MPIDTQTAGYAQAIARVREIIAPLQPAAPASAAVTAGDFAGQLTSAMKGSPSGGAPGTAAGYTSQVSGLGAVAAPAGGGSVGARMAAIATAELGVAEAPPGSNDAPRIAEYRKATPGAGVNEKPAGPIVGGIAASMPRSMRSGATAEVGSTRIQPEPAIQTSVHAWASRWRTTT